MSLDDIVAKLRAFHDHLYPAGEFYSDEMVMLVDAADEITRLRAALKNCEEELDAYYRAEYPTDHPVHQRKLAKALKNNPARVALEGEQR